MWQKNHISDNKRLKFDLWKSGDNWPIKFKLLNSLYHFHDILWERYPDLLFFLNEKFNINYYFLLFLNFGIFVRRRWISQNALIPINSVRWALSLHPHLVLPSSERSPFHLPAIFHLSIRPVWARYDKTVPPWLRLAEPGRFGLEELSDHAGPISFIYHDPVKTKI